MIPRSLLTLLDALQVLIFAVGVILFVFITGATTVALLSA